MKILHVITSLEIGGAQRLLSDFLPLQAKSEDVTLLVYERVSNYFESKILEAGVKILTLNEHNFHNPGVVLKMRKIFKDYDFSMLLEEFTKYSKNVKNDYAQYLKTNAVWDKLKK